MRQPNVDSFNCKCVVRIHQSIGEKICLERVSNLSKVTQDWNPAPWLPELSSLNQSTGVKWGLLPYLRGVQLQHSLCSPAHPQVSRGPFFRGSLKRGHTSPRAASCFGQTMTLTGTWCQLATAVAKALTSCMQRREIPATGICCWPPQAVNSTLRFGLWAPLNSVIPSCPGHTHVSTFSSPSSIWAPRT